MEGRFVLLLLCTAGALGFIGICEAGDKGITLQAGMTLQGGDYLKSLTGKYELRMQYNCNLVLYKVTGAGAVLWKSGTKDKGVGCYLLMQTDANLVIYDSAGAAVWATGTTRSPPQNYRLVMQTNGNVVIRSPSDTKIWATNTAQ